jgi:5'-methylthioadenosine phosphorylase
MSKIAIIGGEGLEMPDYLENVKRLKVETPFGLPDPMIYSGFFEGAEVIHLSRRGNGTDVPPVKINYKANLYALKQQSCSHILASVTCRSLQEEICPGEIITPDQFIDLTTQSISGFYDDLRPGEAIYGPMRDPFSCELCDHLIEAAIIQGITIHTKGIVLSINGPRFSSRAESNLYRSWGADVINMFTAPEVILANELGMSYAALALCTGYDSWRNCDETSEGENSGAIIASNHEKIMHMLTYAIRKIE